MTLVDALRGARRQRTVITEARAEYDNAKRKAKRIVEACREALRLRNKERRGCP